MRERSANTIRVLELRSQGKTTREISDIFQDEGRKTTQGNAYTTSVIHNIIAKAKRRAPKAPKLKQSLQDKIAQSQQVILRKKSDRPMAILIGTAEQVTTSLRELFND